MIEEIKQLIFYDIIEHVSSLEIPEVLGKFSLDKTRKIW